jgi:hypothetical protein
MKRLVLLVLLVVPLVVFPQEQLFKDYTLPLDTRVNDLVARLTLDEKIGQLLLLPRLSNVLEYLNTTGGTKLFMVLQGQDMQPFFHSQ